MKIWFYVLENENASSNHVNALSNCFLFFTAVLLRRYTTLSSVVCNSQELCATLTSGVSWYTVWYDDLERRFPSLVHGATASVSLTPQAGFFKPSRCRYSPAAECWKCSCLLLIFPDLPISLCLANWDCMSHQLHTWLCTVTLISQERCFQTVWFYCILPLSWLGVPADDLFIKGFFQQARNFLSSISVSTISCNLKKKKNLDCERFFFFFFAST